MTNIEAFNVTTISGEDLRAHRPYCWLPGSSEGKAGG